MTVIEEAGTHGRHRCASANACCAREDPALLTGEAKFTNDIQVPGALHLAVLRSPYAHARIKSVDVSGALGHAGRAGRVLGRRPGR